MIVQEDERDRDGQDLATSTLAEIYAQQGLLERARAIYERIAQRSPDDPRIAERIETLTRAIQDRRRDSRPEPDVVAGRDDPPAPVEDHRARDEEPRDEQAGDEAARHEAARHEAARHVEARHEEARDEVFEAWLASR